MWCCTTGLRRSSSWRARALTRVLPVRPATATVSTNSPPSNWLGGLPSPAVRGHLQAESWEQAAWLGKRFVSLSSGCLRVPVAGLGNGGTNPSKLLLDTSPVSGTPGAWVSLPGTALGSGAKPLGSYQGRLGSRPERGLHKGLLLVGRCGSKSILVSPS